jgi:hypothetical protein
MSNDSYMEKNIENFSIKVLDNLDIDSFINE